MSRYTDTQTDNTLDKHSGGSRIPLVGGVWNVGEGGPRTYCTTTITHAPVIISLMSCESES